MTSYLVLFSANLAFILTNLYGWLLKWFYKPKAYHEDFNQLFPAYRSVGWLYLLQAFELPYLLHVGQPEALLYVNAFALLVYPPLLLVMCEEYFFGSSLTPPQGRGIGTHLKAGVSRLLFLGEGLGVGLLLLQALGLLRLPEWHRPVTFVAVGVLFLWFFWRNIRMALRIGRAIRRVNEDTYADSDDFPARTGERMQWIPTAICLLMALNFFLDDPVVKGFRDVFFTVVNVWFCIYTLNPRRKAYEEKEPQQTHPQPLPAKEGSVGHLTPDRYAELSQHLESLLTEQHIFTEPHITAYTLMQHLGIKANYLTEVIQRSGYQSFYDMICQHRVRYAISLIRRQPDRRLADIAEQCGFSSASSMTKAFASQGKQSPSAYRPNR